MKKNISSCSVKLNEHMRGGDGTVKITEIVPQEEMFGKARMFSTILLEPGCSIGDHEHNGECEIFYVVRGTGTYNDNGTQI